MSEGANGKEGQEIKNSIPKSIRALKIGGVSVTSLGVLFAFMYEQFQTVNMASEQKMALQNRIREVESVSKTNFEYIKEDIGDIKTSLTEQRSLLLEQSRQIQRLIVITRGSD